MVAKLAVQEIPSSLKMPPHNHEAECAVLGAVLIDNDSINKVLEILSPEDFYREAHSHIFRAMISLSEKNEPTDFVTVTNTLTSAHLLDMVGGASYLSSLADSIPSSANVVAYAKIIREKSILRRLIEAASTIATSGYEGAEEAESLLDHAERMIFDISENRARASFYAAKDIVKDSFKKIEELFENKKEVTGLATGLTDFDRITCGLQGGDLIIIAARPSMGKTALAINMAEHISLNEHKTVAIFSLEMSKEQIVTRMLCSQSRIDSSKLRKGELSDRDWPALTRAGGDLSEVNLFVDDPPPPTVLEMRAKARRLKKEKGLDLLIVDYLQLVRGSGFNNNREQEISEISRSLKALAKELHVPVVALSQLNRAVENRNNRRPQLADLRESGAIEQDADLITFIYRDEVYDPNSPDRGVAELIVGKQRNGPTGMCRMAFLNQYTRFENLAYNAEQNYDASVET